MSGAAAVLDPPMDEELAELSDRALAETIRAWGRERSGVDERITVGVEELARRQRNRMAASGAYPGRPDSAADKSIRDEVGVILSVNPGSAGRILEIGCGLRRLPLVRQAFGTMLNAEQIHAVIASLAEVDDDVAAQLVGKMLEYAPGHAPTEIRDAGRKRVARADPGGVARRREEAVKQREVTIRPTCNGMTRLSALLPILVGAKIFEQLRGMSTTQVCGRDPRTRAQRQADALSALCLGDRRLRCECGRSDCPIASGPDGDAGEKSGGPVVYVGISDATLLGLRDDPALLEGFGAIDAELARKVARMKGARFVPIPETCPDAHHLGEDVGEARRQAQREGRYRPSADIDRWVRAVDGGCRGPNCRGGAHHSDLDHLEPFDHRDPARGGKTHSRNLAAACRSTHRIKTDGDNTEGGWQVRMVDGDRRTMEWTTPSGMTAVTEPEGRGYLFPHSEPDCCRPPCDGRSAA